MPSEQPTANDFKLVTPQADRASAGERRRRPAKRPPRSNGRTGQGAMLRQCPTAAPEPTNTEDSARPPLRPPAPQAQRRARGLRRARPLLGEGCPATRPSGPTLRRPPLQLARRWSCEPLKKGSQVDRRHGARPGRPDRRPRPAPQLRDPPGRPRRADDRPEADPRRLEAPRGDRDLPRRRQEPVRRPGHRQPGPADVEGAARSARCSPTRSLEIYSCGREDIAPARSTAGCWRCSSTSSPAATA